MGDWRFWRLIKFKDVAADGIGDNTVIAAVPGKKLRILGYLLVSSLGLSVTLKSSGGKLLSGAMSISTNQSLSYSGGFEAPATETDVGEAFVVNNSILANVRGHVAYIEN